MDTDVDKQGNSKSFYVAPREQTVVWQSDLSGTVTVIAGEPYRSPTGASGSIPSSSRPQAAGTVLSHDEFAAGQMGIRFATPPPLSSQEMAEYLVKTAGITDASDPIQVLDSINSLLSEWTLTPVQEASALEILAKMRGIEELGAVSDRLGRPGIAFRATSPTDRHYADIFVLGRQSGSILSIEKVYLGGIAELKLSVPAVVLYTAWKME